MKVPLNELVPMVVKHARANELDPLPVLALLYRESTLWNRGWHADGTGCGLAGLDLGGLLPEFVSKYKLDIGRGSPVCDLPVEEQLEFVTQKLGEMADQYGGFWGAARVWHAGPANRNSSRANGYVAQLKEHVSELRGMYEGIYQSLKDSLPSKEQVGSAMARVKHALEPNEQSRNGPDDGDDGWNQGKTWRGPPASAVPSSPPPSGSKPAEAPPPPAAPSNVAELAKPRPVAAPTWGGSDPWAVGDK